MDMFQTLWQNHPVNKSGDSHPCKDQNGNFCFANQCAICMGIALEDSGISLSSYTGTKCWQHSKHTLRAEELGEWLKTQSDKVGKFQSFKPGKKAESFIQGKRGIVLFRNFWGSNNQGDHIDLWNGSELANGSTEYFARSQEVIFWHTGTIL